MMNLLINKGDIGYLRLLIDIQSCDSKRKPIKNQSAINADVKAEEHFKFTKNNN